MNLREMKMIAHSLEAERPMPDMVLDEVMKLAEHEQRDWMQQWTKIRRSGVPIAADGIYYNDTRPPFMFTDGPDITLATTAKALYTTSMFPSFGGQYMNIVGKRLRIRATGKITTAATPGNGTFAIYWGTGADANGVIMASSAAFALIAGQTTLTWDIDLMIRATSTLGSSGLLRCMGKASFNPAVVASTAQPLFIPASASVDSAAIDLTNGALIPSIQFSRSGSTAEHMWIQDMEVIVRN